MAFQIPDHFNRTFTSNVELLLQQNNSRFSGRVREEHFQGEAAQMIKQFGTVEFQQKTTRNGDTNFSDIEHRQRWIFPTDYDLALPVDKEDELRMLGDIKSPYAMAMRAGWARKEDDVVIDAFFGTAKTGTNGGTSTIFDTANVVAVDAGAAAATGLNIEKLIQAKEILHGNEVDLEMETPQIAVGKKAISDLLRTTEATNSLYSEVKALVEGKINHFMGFDFTRSERLDTDGSGYRRLPVWVPSGMCLGRWNTLWTRIGERPDKKYLTQVFMAGTIGATRTQENKVLEIKCSEA